MKKISFFDTTLRDGEQGIGHLLSNDKKLKLLPELVNLGVGSIEIGMVTDEHSEKFFHEVATSDINFDNTYIASLCRLKLDDIRKTISALNRFNKSKLNLLCVGSETHISKKFGSEKKDIFIMLKDSLEYISSSNYNGKVTAILEDSSRGSFQLLEETISLLTSYHVYDICFADTTGCLTPLYMSKLITHFKNKFPSVKFSVHCHNDLGLAVANSISAIDAGVDEVQVTLGGVGERCGNASFEEILAILYYRNEYKSRFKTDIIMKKLIELCNFYYDVINKKPYPNKPLLGEYAFSTCAGIHQDGIKKSPETYEFINPNDLGLERKFYFNKLSSNRVCQQNL
ncbi:LeuA family protein [Xenorhabdus bovienii]|uniref:2-isopropylmalate synthase n=2 Tax=Xenorhabdus bovienii TaxID=40576 RepID=A0A077NP56_XENBV|nr:LeuA family protein [Xenorhabdus bovienii]MDE1473080.1 LeuA family protein [Xenorhabdus bovienii]MDE9436234.1 LeuA family protein [Xenorhabdus bovienii]MDE9444745.1 LeuA family protein [Xenorhabdus bovienii]MDE9495083.1 LeuA family protein [Xenorhabdus bovienii]MDE9498370.1 LeuA family protein [Xenorhabdus bovienii]